MSLNEKMAQETERVAEVVGKEGKIGHRINLGRVEGAWCAQAENINALVSDVTTPTREMSRVIGAVAKGDLTQTVSIEIEGRPLKGEFLRAAETVNAMVDQLSAFTSEVTRVAREVGTDGKLGGQARVKGVSGTWKDLTVSVNSMASNLTAQVRNIADVTTAVARGDLSKKITVDVRGEFLQLKETVNTMVDQLNSFASEVTRVAREVGTEGKLGGQAEVRGVAGTWRDLTENVNGMASNLTNQMRNIAQVTTAVANGDLSKTITVDAKGEILELKNTVNTMVDQLNSFASEVTRVAREVGTDGKLGGQAHVRGAAGTWKDLTDNVNGMAANLTNQVRNIAEVTTAVARGDLTRKITVDAKGEILELKNTINTMVDQLNSFASEVTRVAREVGTDGKLGGQATVPGVAGTWKDLTDNVNLLGNNLTVQLRDVSKVATAIANGDLSQKITVSVSGEILQIKETINSMVDQLSSFASEVTRVAREVGTDGKLGGQAIVPGVGGTWKDLTDNVNGMAANLTNQVRNIADVTTAVANGDLSKEITVDAKGEILELKNTINIMVQRLNSFSAEVTRVAKEVGTEGKLGGQAEVRGVAGTWKDLTESVNGMAANLTSQVRNIADVTTAVARGDLTRKITVDAKGEIQELKNTINTMVDQLNRFASEVTRVAREVGTDGKLGGQATVSGVAGTWKDLTDNVNGMAANLTNQVRNIAEVTTAVARGDLTRKITVDAQGEIQELKNTINTMVDQLNSFASEVTRVAREVGTDGKLGGQATVPGVAGTWKDLTDNVNLMAANLTDQVRGIARVVTAVANGNLRSTLTVEAKGEIAELADTINNMIGTLATFADQVTTVAREVGVEGRLGGQANVPGAAGTWKDLTDNVNGLAANLTTQVRAIAEVSTAVTKGDLSRSIMVEAAGEVALLKDNVNEMIRNLKETTRKNTEQDWLKTNLATFTRKLQGQRDLQTVCQMTLSELAPLVGAQHGIFYINEGDDEDEACLRLLASYAFRERKRLAEACRAGEGLIGQVLLEKQRILVTDVPPDYVKIGSGLGEAAPANLVVLPVVFEGEVKAAIELGSFQRLSDIHLAFLDQLMESLAIVINTIQTNMRTEELLKQSQSLTEELQSQQTELTEKNERLQEQARSLRASEELLKQQQEELRQTNEALKEKASLLAEQKSEVERKNVEVENARLALQAKAEELSLTSRYKSEFLANMSHELRTPLNSLLILSKILAENPDGNLLEKQVEHARTIYTSGSDLLELINEILDLSKIESGTMSVDIGDVTCSELAEFCERTFRPVAETKRLLFQVELDSGVPPILRTDGKRVQQVLKNLLSNAFKFTETGRVALQMVPATEGWDESHAGLNRAEKVVAFVVRDTGIGIPRDKQRIIFEAFQQADAGTSRKHGGTGLGLSISREIARMLGGTIHVTSEPGRGSAFTLYLPVDYTARASLNGGRNPHALVAALASGVSTVASALQASGAATAAACPLKHATDSFTPPDALLENGACGDTFEDAAVPDPATIEDDKLTIASGDRVLLIVEDNERVARLLVEEGRAAGFKCAVAATAAKAMRYMRTCTPSAATIELFLPDANGWVLLDRWKHAVETRHVPVCVISSDEGAARALRMGALGYLRKPAGRAQIRAALDGIRTFLDRPAKHLLLVEPDDVERDALRALIGGRGDVRVFEAKDPAPALEILERECIDCVALNLRLADEAFAFVHKVKQMRRQAHLPIVSYAGEKLPVEEQKELRRVCEILIADDESWRERLLHETSLFLHRPHHDLSEYEREMIDRARSQTTTFSGRKALVIDDDVRNIFALTTALERWDMDVLYAESGAQALSALEEAPDIDVVLTDIMMPEMDGFACMRRIRSQRRFRSLPIIAVTAKAMKGDREKCFSAGASDYITKPVDIDHLHSLLRVWLYRT